MNKYLAQQKMLEIISKIKIHPQCFQEINELVLGSGEELRFLNILERHVSILREHGFKAIEIDGGLKKLQYAPGLYRMDIGMKAKNMRIIFTIDKTGDILLSAFHERAGKRNSDYSKYVPIAQQRLKDMMEGKE